VKLRVTKRAATQIEKALDYIEAESPQGANRMRERIQTLFLSLFRLLAHHPYAGQLTDLPGVRRLVVSPYPYLIFYRVTDDEVIVQRMRHTSRRPRSASGTPYP
jgi:toxin ParE1/3/4